MGTFVETPLLPGFSTREILRDSRLNERKSQHKKTVLLRTPCSCRSNNFYIWWGMVLPLDTFLSASTIDMVSEFVSWRTCPAENLPLQEETAQCEEASLSTLRFRCSYRYSSLTLRLPRNEPFQRCAFRRSYRYPRARCEPMPVLPISTLRFRRSYCYPCPPCATSCIQSNLF